MIKNSDIGFCVCIALNTVKRAANMLHLWRQCTFFTSFAKLSYFLFGKLIRPQLVKKCPSSSWNMQYVLL
jgi:hypothetical protein